MHFKWCVLGMQGYCWVLLSLGAACVTIGIIEWAWQWKGLVDLCRVYGYTEGLSALWHYCWEEFSKAHFCVVIHLIKTSTAVAFMLPYNNFSEQHSLGHWVAFGFMAILNTGEWLSCAVVSGKILIISTIKSVSCLVLSLPWRLYLPDLSLPFWSFQS